MKIATLVSGGVDSSVAQYLLKKEGHDVSAYYIKIWLEEDFKTCPWEEDLEYVRAVTKKLDVPLKIVNLQEAYWNSIIEYSIQTLRTGRTPNPDILCNRFIKFGKFYDKYGKEFEKVATGHYAKVENKEELRLLMSKDRVKDQTYFLSRITKAQLSRVIFPIGNLLKKEVREIAKNAGLPTYSRPDSQGLCFLGKIKYSDFVRKHLGTKKGEIIEFKSKEVLGKHSGHWFYTIGQRGGLGIGGSSKPYYVSGKDHKNNVVYVVKGKNNRLLYTDIVVLENLNVLSEDLLSEGVEYFIKLRHPHKGVLGKIEKLQKNIIKIKLKEKSFAITPGQFGVLYKNKAVVCSGEIV